jgi:hypothetical protein
MWFDPGRDPFGPGFLDLSAPVPVRPGNLVVLRWGALTADPYPNRQYLVMATRELNGCTWELDLLADPEDL